MDGGVLYLPRKAPGLLPPRCLADRCSLTGPYAFASSCRRYPSVRRSRDAPVLGGRRSGEGSGSGSLSWIRELFGSGDEPASGEAGDP